MADEKIEAKPAPVVPPAVEIAALKNKITELEARLAAAIQQVKAAHEVVQAAHAHVRAYTPAMSWDKLGIKPQ